MEYITNSDFHFKDTAVALGKFDGIHCGHQLLMDEVKKQEKEGRKSAVFTFDRPTRLTLSGDHSCKQIYTKEERRKILEKAGISILIEHPFTKEFAALSPEKFIREILVKKAGARAIVVGTDFRFGKNRSGGIEHLKALEEECGYHLIVIEKLKMDGQDVSSTRIRTCLENGEMEKANYLLGRDYSISGIVVHGNELGRTIQVPTINQEISSDKLVPPNGVYVSRIHIGDEVYSGITNIGVKPTVKDTLEKTVETNIFDFHEDIYGRDVTVELLHFHRPETRFSSIEKLQKQLLKDVEFGKKFVVQSKCR
ncbi:MAG: bifunctional riboflavin kinase/FAD synthetase [Eubacterium sp.]|nr:bifunctional riboflavin kinase/FAD synthetase [Eubacterium sp.]MDD7208720.1 bifunctional riboflavin kinase/FAD synthetase [Lachnospiraceae bacterium]MDY5497747.1 bifunctional riboflavin kinase/FAD synthetase [Anaerobutyricum sp.]